MLVCLGFCGGGVGSYRRWADHVPPDTDLAMVCYPGREGRFAEPFARSWDELAVDATEAVASAADRPYLLFGHSMGGWMAFDVTTRLAAGGGPLPELLIASSCNAPSRGLTERDRFPRLEDTDLDLVRWMQTSGSIATEVLADPDLCQLAVALMRADIRVRDTYLPPQVQAEVPVQVLYGTDDAVIDPAVEAQWSAVTRRTLRVTELPGGHFFTPRVWQELPTRFHGLH